MHQTGMIFFQPQIILGALDAPFSENILTKLATFEAIIVSYTIIQ